MSNPSAEEILTAEARLVSAGVFQPETGSRRDIYFAAKPDPVSIERGEPGRRYPLEVWQ